MTTPTDPDQHPGRAPAGGAIGKNGERYEGGQFLPSSPYTIKGEHTGPRIKAGTKQEVEPYIWRPSPGPDMLSIFARINAFCGDNRKICKYVSGQGFIGFAFTEPLPTYNDYKYGERPVEPGRRAYLEAMIARFNSGERWIPLAEDPYAVTNL